MYGVYCTPFLLFPCNMVTREREKERLSVSLETSSRDMKLLLSLQCTSLDHFFLVSSYKSTLHPILNESSCWYMGYFSLFLSFSLSCYSFTCTLSSYLVYRISLESELANNRADCTVTLDSSLQVRSVGSEQSLYESCN